MAFRIVVVTVALLLGFGTGVALVTELNQPTKTVVEPIVLEAGETEETVDRTPRVLDRPKKVTGDVDREDRGSLPTDDQGEGAQPVPAPAPARAGDGVEVEDDLDDGDDDDQDTDDEATGEGSEGDG